MADWRRGPALAVAALLWLWGCAATVYPPRDVAEPAAVGILDHGRHTSLIVAVPEGMIRYSYGDWNWYALRRTGPIEGTRALLWPTKAGLGRRQLPGPFSPEAVSEQVRVAIEEAVYLTVERPALHRLVARLDGIFDQNRAAAVYNEPYDLWFVPHPVPYSLAHNSNGMVAAWLEQLGCRVEGTPLFAIWRLDAD